MRPDPAEQATLEHARDTAIRMVTLAIENRAVDVADEIGREPHPDIVACILAKTYAESINATHGGIERWRAVLLKAALEDATPDTPTQGTA